MQQYPEPQKPVIVPGISTIALISQQPPKLNPVMSIVRAWEKVMSIVLMRIRMD